MMDNNMNQLEHEVVEYQEMMEDNKKTASISLKAQGQTAVILLTVTFSDNINLYDGVYISFQDQQDVKVQFCKCSNNNLDQVINNVKAYYQAQKHIQKDKNSLNVICWAFDKKNQQVIVVYDNIKLWPLEDFLNKQSFESEKEKYLLKSIDVTVSVLNHLNQLKNYMHNNISKENVYTISASQPPIFIVGPPKFEEENSIVRFYNYNIYLDPKYYSKFYSYQISIFFNSLIKNPITQMLYSDKSDSVIYQELISNLKYEQKVPNTSFQVKEYRMQLFLQSQKLQNLYNILEKGFLLQSEQNYQEMLNQIKNIRTQDLQAELTQKVKEKQQNEQFTNMLANSILSTKERVQSQVYQLVLNNKKKYIELNNNYNQYLDAKNQELQLLDEKTQQNEIRNISNDIVRKKKEFDQNMKQCQTELEQQIKQFLKEYEEFEYQITNAQY